MPDTYPFVPGPFQRTQPRLAQVFILQPGNSGLAGADIQRFYSRSTSS
jgi:hypothetical protein